MLIESVELDNFKSFGNKRTILFKDGFTVITGPNGSGKSNIGDAMLFVLGIRSSKAIRADRLPDLIHKVPPEKKQKSSCSVSIVLDSENPNLPESERKTRITREISVDENMECKSTYYINGAKAKRGDVETILDNAQIYLDAYSFVLQGDINNLVKMTGTERRKLLESIAGIESYNIQIEKAQTDIDGIEENLSKIQILIDENQRRLEQLSVEKKNAERYNELNEKIGSYEVTLLNIDLISVNRELMSYGKILDEINSQLLSQRNKIAELNDSVKKKEDEIRSVEAEKNRFGGEELKNVIEKIKNLTLEKAKAEINTENLKDDIKSLSDRIEEINLELESRKTEKTRIEKESLDLKKKIKETETGLEQCNKRLSELKASSENSSKLFAEYKKEMDRLDITIADLNASILQTTQEESENRGKRESLVSELRHLESRESDILLEYNDAKYKIDANEKESTGSKKAYEELNQKYISLRKSVTEGDRLKDELNRQLIELTKEYEKLSASLSRTSQSSKTYSAILEARANGEITGVYGLVKDLISYDTKMKMAISASGGARLNSVVVEDDAVAERCLNILKRKKAGKLTFLPMNKMLTGRPRAKAIMVKNTGETNGYVFENVRYDKKYENIIWYTFQDCIIVPDTTVARKHMSGVRLVTMDGDIFEASGAITGGFSEKKDEQSETRFTEISDRMASISSELEALKTKLEQERTELDDISTKIATSSKQIGSGSSQISMFIEIRDRSGKELENIRKEIKEIQNAISEQDQKILEVHNKLDQFTDDLNKKTEEKNHLNRKMAEISPEIINEQNELESRASILRSEKEDLSRKDFSIISDLKICDNDITNLIAEKNKDTNAIVSKKQMLQSGLNDIRSLQEELEKYRMLEEQLNSKAKEFNNRLQKLGLEVQALKGNLDTASVMITTLEDNKLSTNLRIQSANDKIQQLNQQIQESKYKPINTDLSVAEIKRELTSLRKELDSLGAVNQLAIAEYDEVNSRLKEMLEKTSKLKLEKHVLEEMMEDLNGKKRTVFLDLYYKINDTMKDIYAVLSEGGEARLDLSDMNDPLNSDLYIRARPKGSTFSKIEALSGGEKSLTAISFILAVQRIKPSPVYYLDEIDMFLDGANAERIGKMFSENAKYSQVLMVSLKKAMLKYADNLIGVTTLDEENTEIYSKDFDSDTEVKP